MTHARRTAGTRSYRFVARASATAAVISTLLLLASDASAAEASDDPHPTPAFKLGVQAGTTYWTEGSPVGTGTSIAQALSVGYNLGLRASVEILPWLAFDARGVMLHNGANPLGNGGSLTTLGGFGAARLTLPIAVIQPYALIGFGAYHYGASGAGTALLSGTVPAAVAGLGAMVPVGGGFDVGFEYTYAFLIGESLSANDNIEGGDPSTMSLFLQYRIAP